VIASAASVRVVNEGTGGPKTFGSAPGEGAKGAGAPSARGSASAPSEKPLLPTLSLPKGGGAIRGIGEKLTTNPATGTGALSVPIATSPGRSGFELGLELGYDSGAGNGPFGLGWSVSTPSITRKTDKGLPRYLDAEESDVFLLSGAEDLVPALRPDGTRDAFARGGFRIERFRPRTEGLFARIERWTNQGTGDAHWQATTRDNVLSVYGRSPEARIADPERPGRVFSWLLEETHDDRGNVARYTYKAEDGAGVTPRTLSESNRFARQPDGSLRLMATAQRYLKRVHYGNKAPIADRTQPAPADPEAYLFEVVFDYGEHDEARPTPDEAQAWGRRDDPFSTYRATFEQRTYRLCRRVLMFHRFPELGATPCLVRSTDLRYEACRVTAQRGAFDEGPVATYLTAVTQAGYQRAADDGPYERQAMPPLELGYVRPVLHDTLAAIDPGSLEGIASGVEGAGAQWVDLDGEGIPGVLIPTERAWYYKANLGDGQLAPPALERTLPAPAELRGGTQQLTDLGGDGNLDLVRYAPPLAGYFARTPERTWDPFVALPSLPNLDWDDPNLRFLDLDGDGFPDVLVTEHDAFVWYRSRAHHGFEPAARTTRARDEREGPAVVFADGTETIQLADMSGDGLVDIVRVRNGQVCYWPNLGYGRFGRQVALDGSPLFDHVDQFDPGRVRFADVDGSGTSDLVYLGRDGARIYLNLSGNALSAPYRIESLPPVDGLSSLSVVDLLGQGTACLVWSSPAPGHATRPMAYVDLMGGKKPHLLDRVTNHLGAETRLAYTSSTTFYLRDKAAGRPWLTRLASPVQVVERIERVDHIARSRLVTRLAYHHGYFDGHEREFRGFARVEQWDAESFSGAKGTGLFPELPYDVDPDDDDLDLPPVRTVTWFHTGAWLERERLELELAREYYDQDPQAPLLPDTVLPPGLSVQEQREAARALRGQILRQEIYAEDGTDLAPHPYTVSERNYEVQLLQPVGGQKHAVFFVHPRHTIDLHYERRPDDPRMQHEVVLAVDRFGNVTRSAALAYPRRSPGEPEQQRLWATITEETFAHLDDQEAGYRVSVPVETVTCELTGLATPGMGVHSIETLRDADAAAGAPLPYEAEPGAGIHKRVVERERFFYYRDHASVDAYWADPGGPLPLGEITLRAVGHHVEKLALTPGLVTQVYDDRVSDDLLRDAGRYVERDGAWWAPSGRTIHDPDRFLAAVGAVDPFGERHLVRYDDHVVLVLDAEDPAGNRTTAGLRDDAGDITENGNDYRVLAPRVVSDPNRNQSVARFDALGMVVATWVRSRDGIEGDDDGNPGAVFRYDLDAWREGRGPAFAHAAVRERHRLGGEPFDRDPSGDEDVDRPRRAGFQHERTYSDGSGREAMKKVQAEGGEVPVRLPGGGIERHPDGSPVTRAEARRWVGTGRTVFDNKGNPVKKYEPFFSDTLAYEDEAELVEHGVTPVLRYDPLGRLVRTDQPSGTHSRIVVEAWREETWDDNDTVLESAWYARWHDPPTQPAQLLPFVLGFAPPWATAPTTHQCAGELCRTLGLRAPTAAQAAWLEAPAGPTPALWVDVVDRLADVARAARLAAAHADTPGVAHLDGLGRSFLSIADNGPDTDGNPRRYPTRLALDVEGNERSVTDANDVETQTRTFDVLGRVMQSAGPDAGAASALLDVADKPVRAWDARGYAIERRYDLLQRPTHLYAQQGSGPRRLVERVVYGERHPQAEDRNLRAQPYQAYDGAGAVTNLRFDFKGHAIETTRRLAREYTEAPDWSPLAADLPPGDLAAAAEPLLELETFQTTAHFDALGRIESRTTPDASVTLPAYNEAGLLDAVTVRVRGDAAATPFVTNIDYNARGERERIHYGNDVVTTYRYDPTTFRLARLTSRRGDALLQDLTYTQDPVGNVVAIDDAVSFGNPALSASAAYEYDPLYQLVRADGREHPGQQPAHQDASPIGMPPPAHPNDWQALRRYRETYEYDRVGNLLAMAHDRVVAGGGLNREWRRRYEYEAASNRLLGTSVPGDADDQYSARYAHDAAGNLREMPHLGDLAWDHASRLAHVSKQVQGGGAANDVYFAYDATGERVRKVYVHGGLVEERIYLGGYEVYRRRGAASPAPDLERQTLHVMDDARRIALVETKTIDTATPGHQPSPRLRFQLDNHLGSSSLELDDAGAVISYEEYFPYGGTAFRAAAGTVDVSAKRFRYSGKERDEETGLYYYGARYYAAWLGRWTSPDPAGLIDGVNRYRFARNRPTTLVDPKGFDSEEPGKKWEYRPGNAPKGKGKEAEAKAHFETLHNIKIGKIWWDPKSKDPGTGKLGVWRFEELGKKEAAGEPSTAADSDAPVADQVKDEAPEKPDGEPTAAPQQGDQKGSSVAGTIADLVTDFVPIVSNIKDAIIAITGVNPVTGEKVGVGGRILAGIFAIPGLGNAAKYGVKGGKALVKGGKWVGRGIAKGGRWLKGKAGSLWRRVRGRKPTRTTAIRRVGDLLESAHDVLANPSLLQGKSLADVRMRIGRTPGWVDDVMRHSTTHPQGGWVFRELNAAGTDFTGRMIQYHPGTSRHFGGRPYWKVSGIPGQGPSRIPLN
jgi:RHS repeat-associated protein